MFNLKVHEAIIDTDREINNHKQEWFDKYIQYFGPSGVRALPLAAGINVVAIVLGIISLSFL